MTASRLGVVELLTAPASGAPWRYHPDFCGDGTGAGELAPGRSVHASSNPLRMSSTPRTPAFTALSRNRRDADQNAIVCATETLRRAGNARLNHRHTRHRPIQIRRVQAERVDHAHPQSRLLETGQTLS